MAEKELDDVAIANLNQKMREVYDTYGALDKSMKLFKISIQDGNTTLKSQSELYKTRKLMDKGLNEEIKNLTDDFKSGRQTYDTTISAFQKMRESILESTAGNIELQKSLETELNFKERTLKLELGYQKYLGEFVGFVKQTGKSLLDSAQSGGSSLEMGLQNAAIGANILHSAFQTITKAGMSVGQALMTIPNPAAQVVGALTYAASYILRYAETQLKDAFDAAKPFLDKEVKILDEAFRNSARAGALFTDGAMGMSRAASLSGLRLEAFSKAVGENSENISLLGGNITRGIQQIARVNRAILDGDIGRNLLNLGYNLEEIPGLIAQVGGRMKRAGLAVDDQSLLKATADYAKNLRIIADITGKDAKTALDQADARMNDLAFQQQLMQRGGDVSLAMQQSLAALPENVQDMVKEMVVSGGQLTSDVTNLTAQQVPALKAVADQVYAAFQSNSLTVKTGADALATNAASALEQIKGMTDFARAGSIMGDNLRSVNEGLMAGLNSITKLADPQTYEAMKKNAEDASKTTDETTQSLNTLKTDANETARALQNLTTDVLPAYVDIIKKLNAATLEVVNAFGLLTGRSRTGLTGQQTRELGAAASSNSQVSSGFLGSNIGTIRQNLLQMTDENITQLAEQNQVTVDQIARAVGYNDFNALQSARATQQQMMESMSNTPILAAGGIASGPDSGFLATLHGREAVIPLPSSVTSEDLPEYLRNLIAMGGNAMTEDMARAAAITGSESVQAISGTNELMQTLISKVDQLIDATRSVAEYTERTSVRVA